MSMASVDGLDVSAPGWLRLLYYLVRSPKTPTELASLEKKHLSEVSRTLRSMRDVGLVEYTETGSRERYYRATDEGYVLLRRSLR
jgi:predicted transcriptional regulator